VYPPGFEPDRVLTLRMQFPGPRYREATARRAHAAELLERARRAPGVEAVGLSSNRDGRMTLQVEGMPAAPRGQAPSVVVSAASAGYAPAIGMQIVRGRWLSDDEPQPAFVINEALARQAFRDGDPIGRRIRIPARGDPRFGTIVGVAADLRYASLDIRPEPELFIDYADTSMFGVTLAIRTTGDPASAAPTIRTLLGAVDRTQPLFDVRPLEVALADSIAPRRFTMLLLGAFAVTAMMLAMIGIYGVVAYAVAQRTHEIGVRLALGTQRRQVIGMVVRQGMAIALVGIVTGIVAAVPLTHLLTTLLYEVTPTDRPTFAVVVSLLVAAAFTACASPRCVPRVSTRSSPYGATSVTDDRKQPAEPG
jgi:putative ABC transport system permease protein